MNDPDVNVATSLPIDDLPANCHRSIARRMDFSEGAGLSTKSQGFMQINSERILQVTERLVDVLNGNKAVLHIYPITIGAPNITSNDTEYSPLVAKERRHARVDAGHGRDASIPPSGHAGSRLSPQRR
jgi:hypothetical protein